MSSLEKASLPYLATADAPSRPAPRRSRLPFVALIFILLILCYQTDIFSIAPSGSHPCTHGSLAKVKCPAQPKALNVGADWDPISDDKYSSLAANRLSKAVQLNTVSVDTMPMNASDQFFDKHYAFSKFLEKEFPTLYTDLKHEYVNTHGHLFTWEGKNPDLKPIVLMAHIDTVPVLEATLDQWTFPPFEGRITVNATDDTPGTWLWGRGVSDCKNSLIGIYAAMEKLVSEGFQPERTVLIANGFDEEVGGPRGAAKLGELIEARYGPDSISFILDEGFSGISTEYGRRFASFGMAEKGSVNFGLLVETLGGHSSVPPPHTGIGIMSLFLSELEANPFLPSLNPSSPFLNYLSCVAEHAPGAPKAIKKGVKDPKSWPKLAKDLAASDRIINSYLATSQAIDLIQGGVKVNALPEVVEATVNYRISFTSSVKETKDHVSSVLIPLAKKLNFTTSIWPSSSMIDNLEEKSSKHLTLYIPQDLSLEPAPITPADSPSFELMAGTARHIWGEETIAAPTGMYANTDTKWFWTLSKNIFRFTPAEIKENLYQHTVNERISLAAHLDTTRFYYKLIRNLDGWDD